jgi:hypothetical protein
MKHSGTKSKKGGGQGKNRNWSENVNWTEVI